MPLAKLCRPSELKPVFHWNAISTSCGLSSMVSAPAEVPDGLEQGLFGRVHMGDEIHDPAVVLEAEPPIGVVGLDSCIGPLIANTDLETAVEERHHLARSCRV